MSLTTDGERQLENYAQARRLLFRTLERMEKYFGPSHPEVAVVVGNLGAFYHGDGQLEQAEPLYRRALAIDEEFLGSDHPKAQRVRKNYVALLRQLGRDIDADQLERQ